MCMNAYSVVWRVCWTYIMYSGVGLYDTWFIQDTWNFLWSPDPFKTVSLLRRPVTYNCSHRTLPCVNVEVFTVSWTSVWQVRICFCFVYVVRYEWSGGEVRNYLFRHTTRYKTYGIWVFVTSRSVTNIFLECVGSLVHTIVVMLVARWDHKDVRLRKHKTGNSSLDHISIDLIHHDYCAKLITQHLQPLLHARSLMSEIWTKKEKEKGERRIPNPKSMNFEECRHSVPLRVQGARKAVVESLSSRDLVPLWAPCWTCKCRPESLG